MLTPKYERQWTLGQIINPLIETGLRMERFEEHPDPYWEQFPNMPDEVARLAAGGVTALEGLDSGPVAMTLLACTVNV